MSEYERKQNVESLRKKLSGRQNFFKKVNTIQEAATRASYIVAYNIAKNNKALSDGEFVMKVCDVLCPDKKNNFQTVSLSRKTVTSRIEAIDKNLTSQLESKIGQFKFCSIAMDESTNINDTAQLVLFIRGVDENFEITEELACMRSLKGTTKGCDIFREFQEGLLTLKVPITNICNITTDGAPNMTEKKSGFLGLFNQNYPGNNIVLLLCVIHQDALCKSALNMKPVLDAVVKLVNTIRSRGLTHRQFRDFLQSVQSEYSDVLYYTKVRWLIAGCVFERVWQLKDDIVSFFHEKQCSAECEMLEDTEWLSDFAFFTDLLCHMNNLNVKMQGKNQFIVDIWAHLKAFKLKLNLFAG
ncbi:General transcription factor II-I repeat domain-containing protein 2A [Araneus ventricosus]|uniref:General transcription factor II-I repeat domain-containing protein 2A n=1 Tax=Araneus ventricosus TaxID=182803 RepID=A0A4Y2U5E0_ARAVE|nr:General transcription factor II-I repeat domain-containing protein 2A [Araneus ventricosus]